MWLGTMLVISLGEVLDTLDKDGLELGTLLGKLDNEGFKLGDTEKLGRSVHVGALLGTPDKLGTSDRDRFALGTVLGTELSYGTILGA